MNVDRLLKSPASQRGRDFGIILAYFRDEGYTVEWRVINATDYVYQQRRRRTFIFAYKNEETKYAKDITSAIKYVSKFGDEMHRGSIAKQIFTEGFLAKTFHVNTMDSKMIKIQKLPEGRGDLSAHSKFDFENAGVMRDGVIYTVIIVPSYDVKQITLGDIMDEGEVDEKYFIPNQKLYYTYSDITHSDESQGKLPKEQRQTWQYLKGTKKLPRKAANGHEYIFSVVSSDL